MDYDAERDDGDFEGVLPDLSGDGRSDLDDFVLFAALSDRASKVSTAKSGCGCLLPAAVLIVALFFGLAATITNSLVG